MFIALVMLAIFGVPATGFLFAGVFLVRKRMSESITSVGAILGVLAISFGAILAIIALYVFIMLVLGDVTLVGTTESG